MGDGLVDEDDIEIAVLVLAGNTEQIREMSPAFQNILNWNRDERLEIWEIEEAKGLLLIPGRLIRLVPWILNWIPMVINSSILKNWASQPALQTRGKYHLLKSVSASPAVEVTVNLRKFMLRPIRDRNSTSNWEPYRIRSWQ